MGDATEPHYASVVIDIDAPLLAQPFTYRIPADFVEELSVGDAVMAPFGNVAERVGYVVGITAQPPAGIASTRIRDITARITGAAAFDQSLWEAAKWVAEQTLCDLREVVKLIAPDPAASHIRTIVHLAPDWRERFESVRAAGALDVIERLSEAPEMCMPQPELIKAVGPGAEAALTALRRRGVVSTTRAIAPPEVKTKTVRLLRLCVDVDVALAEADPLEARAPRQARLLRDLVEAARSAGSVPAAGGMLSAQAGAAAKSLAAKGLVRYDEVIVRRDPFALRLARTSAPPMTDEQSAACRQIGRAVAGGARCPFLLYGVTGSGKTEVYLDAIAQVRAAGRGALLLLPEIGLSAQVLDLLKARFGDEVAVLHSAISAGERFDEWQRIRRGEASIVVGARSAVFAPIANLGLIVIDEEHDSAYKQDTTPRYHAREVALFRGRQSGAAVVLGSATPSLESFFRAKIGLYDLLTLTKRISDRPLPSVRIVDLRNSSRNPLPGGKPPTLPETGRVESQDGLEPASAEKALEGAPAPAAPDMGLGSVFSDVLRDAISDRLARREQVILFLNRRGFSPFLLCRDCGYTPRCGNCDVSLTFHRGARLLQCHHCDSRRQIPDACPRCGGSKLNPFGIGTEKVEEAVVATFEGARTLRMDRDTTERKGSHASILRAFRSGEADILIGTQMVAKGLDFPRVTLVGVVSADTALNMPDYHAAEAAFQLLTQVSGRAGRGERPGEVLVQTFDPENETIKLASTHDYEGFYFHEIGLRSELRYPPFARLANVVITDEVEQRAIERCEKVADQVRYAVAQMREDHEAQVLGPVACPLGKLRNRYRWHLMLRCATKPALLSILRRAIGALPAAERTALTVDIDPMSMI